MDKKETTAEEALEVSLLISLLAATGHKDGDEFKKILVGTFTNMLTGFGYEVCKSGSES